MFGKAFSSQAPSANKRLFGSSLCVDCHSVLHLSTSVQRDVGNGMSFSQNSMPPTSSSSCSALLTIIDGTTQGKLRAWQSSSKLDPRLELIIIVSSSPIDHYEKTVAIPLLAHNIIFGMKKGVDMGSQTSLKTSQRWVTTPSTLPLDPPLLL